MFVCVCYLRLEMSSSSERIGVIDLNSFSMKHLRDVSFCARICKVNSRIHVALSERRFDNETERWVLTEYQFFMSPKAWKSFTSRADDVDAILSRPHLFPHREIIFYEGEGGRQLSMYCKYASNGPGVLFERFNLSNADEEFGKRTAVLFMPHQVFKKLITLFPRINDELFYALATASMLFSFQNDVW